MCSEQIAVVTPKIESWIDKNTGMIKDLKDLSREELIQVIEYMTPLYIKGLGIDIIYKKP